MVTGILAFLLVFMVAWNVVQQFLHKKHEEALLNTFLGPKEVQKLVPVPIKLPDGKVETAKDKDKHEIKVDLTEFEEDWADEDDLAKR